MKLAICINASNTVLTQDKIYEVLDDHTCKDGRRYVAVFGDPSGTQRCPSCKNYAGWDRSRFRFLNDPDSVTEREVTELYTPQEPVVVRS